MRRRFPQFALAAATLVLAAAGCGGDESDAAGYRERVSALCAEAIREAEDMSPPRKRADWEPFLEETLAYARDVRRRFRALEPPAELADEHRLSLRLDGRVERLTRELLSELNAGRSLEDVVPGYLNGVFELTRRSNELSRSMDLPECVVPLPGDEPAAPA